MELRHLRCFLAVADELNFRRAAERLGMSQPPVTISIQQLEAELGVSLFDRTNRTVRLSQGGVVFRRKVKELMEGLEEATHLTRQAEQGQVDVLKIGFLVPAAWGVLPQALERFRLKYPRVQIRLEPQDLKIQADEIVRRTCDLYLGTYLQPDRTIATRRLKKVELRALVPPHHRLAGDHPISIRELANETILIPSSTYSPKLRSEVMEFCRVKGGFQPKIIDDLDPPSLAVFVLSGLGIGLFHAMGPKAIFSELYIRPFKEKSPQVQSGLAWRRERESPVLKVLIDEIVRATHEQKTGNPSHLHAKKTVLERSV